MGYIEQSLGENEKLFYRGHFHWLRKAAGWAVLAMFFAGALVAFVNEQGPLAIILCALGVIFFFISMYPVWSQQVVVTNERLIRRRGLIGRSTEELLLDSIEEVRVEQGVIGRLMDFGRVLVTGTGERSIRLPILADPVGLRQNLQDAQADDVGSAREPAVPSQ